MPGELLDVVDQAVELPLTVDFRLAAQRESGEPLVVAEIAEHGLHGAKAFAVPLPSLRGIDATFHARRVRFR